MHKHTLLFLGTSDSKTQPISWNQLSNEKFLIDLRFHNTSTNNEYLLKNSPN